MTTLGLEEWFVQAISEKTKQRGHLSQLEKLNHRPRKTLGFKTPYELFFKKNTLLTVALHT
jgi:IS30 family transposase